MAPARNIAEQIERQARRWEIQKRVAEPRPPAPCIAISRLPGSGADRLGRSVAEKLEYGFFGIEIVDQIAREQHIRRRLIDGLDEHVRTAIERYVSDAFRTRAITESEYLRHVVRAVTTLGERGSAVILGRGAPFILPPERALRILVVAPDDARAARIAREQSLSPKEVRAELARQDADRIEFLRRDFGVSPNDPRLYDLVVNTASLGQDAAAALVVEAHRRRFAS